MRWNCLVIALTLALLAGRALGQEEIPTPGPDTTVNAGTPGTIPSPGSQALDSADLFGARTGYLHPFLSVSSFATSNLFRTADNEQAERYAVIVPGLWLALPARTQRYPEIATLNTAPGGLGLSRFTGERERRLQGYAQYQASIIKYDRYPEEDRIDHRGQGMLKFSSRGGLSLELADLYERNSDPYGTGGREDRTLDTFDANLFSAILVNRLSSKVLLRADYGRYQLNYSDASSNYRDRSDNSYAGYFFFQSTPRTAFFLQGEHIAIDYDQDRNLDSRHNNFYLGAQIQTSAKTRGYFKAGYGMQDYGSNESGSVLAEAQLDYFFTPRTSISLLGTRRILETDQIGASSILSHRLQVGYRQRLTARWVGDAGLFFTRNDYDGTVSIGNRIARNYYHDEYGGQVTLGLVPLRWMSLSLGDEYRERDSNFDSEDYRSNTIFLRAAAAF